MRNGSLPLSYDPRSWPTNPSPRWAVWVFVAACVAGPAFGAAPTPDCDINDDGVVDASDLLLFVEYWHTTHVVAPTPTDTPSELPAPTDTPLETGTPTATPSHTRTGTPTGTPADTDTAVPPPTDTPTGEPADTDTPFPPHTDTPTGTPMDTETPVAPPTDTPTSEPADTDTPLPPPTDTPSGAPTNTDTAVPPPTDTPTGAPTDTDTAVPPPTDTPGPPPDLLTLDLPGGVTMELVLCPAGSFQMGGSSDWASIVDQPVHTVTFTKLFYVQKTEVTQAQWQAVMGSLPNLPCGAGPDYPVYFMSWHDCQTFVAALNAHLAGTAQGPATYRLPSEAEWEYACRAGTTTRFSFGDSGCERSECTSCELDDYAWWCGNNDPACTKPVRQKLPNPWGLFDMHGNVAEWCQDAWHADYTGAPADGSAWEGAGSDRVVRGGGWGSYPSQCRSASRRYVTDAAIGNGLGLRVCRTVTDWIPTPAPTETDTPAPTDTPTLSPTETPPEQLTFDLPGDVTMELVLCPAGSFVMGTTETGSWSQCNGDCERPTHTVTFAEPFYLQKTEVTQAQWAALMGSNPSAFPGCGGDCPVEQVSWEACQAFLTALNDHIAFTGQGPSIFRLPSEAEWEYAARAGTTTRFHFGDSGNCDVVCADCAAGTTPGNRTDYMWYCGNNHPNGTKAVGGKIPNAWGLHDMHGNVWEWCEDRWHEDYTGAPTDGSAWLVSPHTERVLRGGGWGSWARTCRSTYRRGNGPAQILLHDLGLRVARSAWPSPTPMPTETPTGVPTETPTGVPTETPTGVPTETPTGVPTETPGPPLDLLTLDLPGGVTMALVLCPAGSFVMGSDDPAWSEIDEQPVHPVTVAEPFYMQTTELTQAQWVALMGSNPSDFSACGGDCPVDSVSWEDCQTFVTALNDHVSNTGQGPATFRLPSEAEWEYAARAGTTTRFSFGDSTCEPYSCEDCDLSDFAWYCKNETEPVGGKLPNPWGLYDMHGNVSEWCEDDWHVDYLGAPEDGSAWVDAPRGTQRVLRGGDWDLLPVGCTSSRRRGTDATVGHGGTGFRLVRTAAP